MKQRPAQRIILTGFMGAGKTTVALALARRLNCQMIDLDEFIARREGRSIRDIIDEDGEAQFREIETRALLDALEAKAARVVALGGGTWTLERNRALVAEQDCLTVWLDAPFELCWQRIKRDAGSRPLAREQERARRLYDERQAIYKLAMMRIAVRAETEAEKLAVEIIKATQDSLSSSSFDERGVT